MRPEHEIKEAIAALAHLSVELLEAGRVLESDGVRHSCRFLLWALGDPAAPQHAETDCFLRNLIANYGGRHNGEKKTAPAPRSGRDLDDNAGRHRPA